jgi:hypothetical protein
MTVMQWFGFGSCLVLILGIGFAAQFRWLPEGKARTVLVFLAAAGAMASLLMTGLPPQWFAGGKTGFGIALSMSFGAIIPGAPDEQSFRRPFFLGTGLVLLTANIVRAGMDVL